MPDDQGNQPQNPNQPTYTEPQPTQYLTDEVAPDISSPNSYPTPEPTPPAPEPPAPATQPVSPAPNFPMPQPAPAVPVTPPLQPATSASFAPARRFPIVTLLLMLIAIGAIAATYFFYLQTQSLNTQLNQLSKTLQNQQTLSPTPTPSESVTPEASVSATPTATVSGLPTPSSTITPTLVSSLSPLKAFDQMTLVLGTAQAKYPDAQLILIQVYHGENSGQAQTKYWFRQTPTLKKYLYVLKESGKNLVLLDDSGLKVSPDNNIPSLNQMALNNQLGIDLPDAISIALANCPSNYDCANSSISAQFIKANTTLWELTLTAPNSNTPFVIQIDSITKKILFKSS